MVWENLVLYFRLRCFFLYVWTWAGGECVCCHSSSGMLLPVTEAGAFSSDTPPPPHPSSLIALCLMREASPGGKALVLMPLVTPSCFGQPSWYSIKGSRKERRKIGNGKKEKRTPEISGGAGDTVQQLRVLLTHGTRVLFLAPMSCSSDLLVTPAPRGIKIRWLQ